MNTAEYEIIEHNPLAFRIFVVNLLSRAPHTHKDYEISCILDGSVWVAVRGQKRRLGKGELFLANPYEVHDLRADDAALLLSLQISPEFFREYFPQIEHGGFDRHFLQSVEPSCRVDFSGCLCELAVSWFEQNPFHELRCAMLINLLFYHLLRAAGFCRFTLKEEETFRQKGLRMRKLIRYIDSHYSEKLLLGDLARAEDVSLYYLSHFFRNEFGMSFQDYLAQIRCEHARQLLLMSDLNLLDIGLACGFSDPKYFNRQFRILYGLSPKEYRKKFESEDLEKQQKSLLTTQEFLSRQAALIVLDRYGHRTRTDTE